MARVGRVVLTGVRGDFEIRVVGERDRIRNSKFQSEIGCSRGGGFRLRSLPSRNARHPIRRRGNETRCFWEGCHLFVQDGVAFPLELFILAWPFPHFAGWRAVRMKGLVTAQGTSVRDGKFRAIAQRSGKCGEKHTRRSHWVNVERKIFLVA